MNVGEIMTQDPMTVSPTDSIRQAIQILQALEIRHLPVVDEDGTLVGILSDRDLRQLSTPYTSADQSRSDVLSTLDRRISEIMSSDVCSLDAEADVSEAIDVMIENKVGAVPVIDGPSEELVGILSYVDVLRALRNQT